MPIPFDNIPANVLVPLFYAETRGAQTPYNASLKLMLVGHKNTAGGAAAVNTPYHLSGSEAVRLFGPGSMLEAMFRKARMQSPWIEIWGVAAAPDVDAVAATGSILVTAAPSRAGNITVAIAGYGVNTIVRATDTTAGVAAKIRTNINGATQCPVTAALDPANTSKVILTCKWKGITGNFINVEKSFYGADNDLAAIITVTQMADGLGMGSLAGPLAAIDDTAFDVLAVGTRGDEPQIAALDAYFDHDTGRWSPYKQTFGHAFLGFESAFANVITYGAALNCPHVTIMGIYNSPTPHWEWAAAMAARATQHWATPPELSRPLHKIELNGIIAARNPAERFTLEERQALLTNGLSTYTVDQDGTVRIDRLVTTYKRNVWGDPDASWRDAVTMFQIMFFIRSMRTAITGNYPRAALTDHDTGIPGFTSPEQIHDTLVSTYKFLESQGLVENTEVFAEALVVERNAYDANRIDILCRPDLVNQLRVVAMLVETHLTTATIQAA